MSASKQKKTRIAMRENGENNKATAAAEKAKESKKYRAKVIIAIAVIVVLVVGSLIITSDRYYTKKNALTVGDTNFSAAEVNYYYKTTFNNIYENLSNTLGSMLGYILDVNTPLSEQAYTEDQTWADYVMENTIESMKQTAVYCESAARDGYTLSEDGKATVEQSVETMRSYATMYNYSNLDGFLVSLYGRGMNEKTYTDILNRVTLASEYANSYLDSLNYTEEELDAYYAEHAEEFDYYDYYLYPVSATSDLFSDQEDDDAKNEAAKKAAEELAENKTYDELLAAIREFVGADASLSLTHNIRSNIGESYRDWVMDPSRKAGDTTVIDSENIYYVILYVGYDDNNYETVDMRHILIQAEADEDGNYTDEALEEAKLKIEEIESQWRSEATVENFAVFAATYSEDNGSKENGGLYEQVAKNSMVPEINDFLFNQGSSVGDTAICYGNNGSYAGYHLVLYAGTNTRNCNLLAESAKTSEDFSNFYENLSAGYEAVQGKGMKYVSVD